MSLMQTWRQAEIVLRWEVSELENHMVFSRNLRREASESGHIISQKFSLGDFASSYLQIIYKYDFKRF